MHAAKPTYLHIPQKHFYAHSVHILHTVKYHMQTTSCLPVLCVDSSQNSTSSYLANGVVLSHTVKSLDLGPAHAVSLLQRTLNARKGYDLH